MGTEPQQINVDPLSEALRPLRALLGSQAMSRATLPNTPQQPFYSAPNIWDQLYGGSPEAKAAAASRNVNQSYMTPPQTPAPMFSNDLIGILTRLIPYFTPNPNPGTPPGYQPPPSSGGGGGTYTPPPSTGGGNNPPTGDPPAPPPPGTGGDPLPPGYIPPGGGDPVGDSATNTTYTTPAALPTKPGEEVDPYPNRPAGTYYGYDTVPTISYGGGYYDGTKWVQPGIPTTSDPNEVKEGVAYNPGVKDYGTVTDGLPAGGNTTEGSTATYNGLKYKFIGGGWQPEVSTVTRVNSDGSISPEYLEYLKKTRGGDSALPGGATTLTELRAQAKIAAGPGKDSNYVYKQWLKSYGLDQPAPTAASNPVPNPVAIPSISTTAQRFTAPVTMASSQMQQPNNGIVTDTNPGMGDPQAPPPPTANYNYGQYGGPSGDQSSMAPTQVQLDASWANRDSAVTNPTGWRALREQGLAEKQAMYPNLPAGMSFNGSVGQIPMGYMTPQGFMPGISGASTGTPVFSPNSPQPPAGLDTQQMMSWLQNYYQQNPSVYGSNPNAGAWTPASGPGSPGTASYNPATNPAAMPAQDIMSMAPIAQIIQSLVQNAPGISSGSRYINSINSEVNPVGVQKYNIPELT